jgi:hypothetical protein
MPEFIRRNGWDYIRNYRPTDDTTLPEFQFNIYSSQRLTFQIYIEFEYRIPMLLNRVGHATVRIQN